MHLAEELDTSSYVCKLRQQADGLQQRVTKLQAELSAVLQESQSRCDLITSLESQLEGRGQDLSCDCLVIKTDWNKIC